MASKYSIAPLFVVLAFLLFDPTPCPAAGPVTIIEPAKPELPEHLAAKEIRRYLYLRTDALVSIAPNARQLLPSGDLILVGHSGRPLIKRAIRNDAELAKSVESLKPEQYLLKTIPFGEAGGRKALLVVGGDPVGTLYGAYRLAEHLGVRFYLHGDVVPDAKIALALPELEDRGEPLFQTRGIQPFHDFPEGPDWWNTDNYKAIIAQLPKLGKQEPELLLTSIMVTKMEGRRNSKVEKIVARVKNSLRLAGTDREKATEK